MDEIQWAEALRGFSFDAPDTLTPERPNVFRIAGFPQREQVSSNMLAWLFDPQGNHGLGTLAVEALLALIGRTDIAPDEVTVETEVGTDDGKRIDILVCMSGLAVVVENKVGAWLYNDLPGYRAHAVKANGTEAVVVVLTPHHQDNLCEYEKQGLVIGGSLFEVLYDELFDGILGRLGGRIMDADSRAVDLLMQYIDNYSPKRNEKVMEERDEIIKRFANATENIRGQVVAFRYAFDDYASATRDKISAILDGIEARVAEGLTDPAGRTVSVGHPWKYPSRGQASAYYGMTFHLEGGEKGDVSIELITDTNLSHVGDWGRDDSPIATEHATFDSLMYKAYREDGRHGDQKNRAIEKHGESLVCILDGANLSDPIDELCEKIAELYRSILEKAWEIELTWDTEVEHGVES